MPYLFILGMALRASTIHKALYHSYRCNKLNPSDMIFSTSISVRIFNLTNVKYLVFPLIIMEILSLFFWLETGLHKIKSKYRCNYKSCPMEFPALIMLNKVEQIPETIPTGYKIIRVLKKYFSNEKIYFVSF